MNKSRWLTGSSQGLSLITGSSPERDTRRLLNKGITVFASVVQWTEQGSSKPSIKVRFFSEVLPVNDYTGAANVSRPGNILVHFPVGRAASFEGLTIEKLEKMIVRICHCPVKGAVSLIGKIS